MPYRAVGVLEVLLVLVVLLILVGLGVEVGCETLEEGGEAGGEGRSSRG